MRVKWIHLHPSSLLSFLVFMHLITGKITLTHFVYAYI